MASRNRKVCVWGRFRPTSNFAHDSIEILGDQKSVSVHMLRDPKKGIVNNQILDWSFKLDGVFYNTDQEVVYKTLVADIVSASTDGYNGTLMCYGQTGAGKTFTMTGATESYRHRGIIPRSISQLFKEIEGRLEYSITVRVSYLEIYNEGMFDLLGALPEMCVKGNKEPYSTPDPMVVSENQDGVFVKGLSCHLAHNEEEALNLLFEGETNRSIAAHQLNKQSSRSHCIFTIYLESRSRTQSNAKYTVSKLNFVDLAGSERLGKSKSEGKTREEAMYINKSLSFLEQVVIALASKTRDHVPFRQSKLTHYLKDSIGGNCSTVLIANLWGEKLQLDETVSTLRFATRMMCVASEPCINEVYDPTLLVKKLQREIHHLKAELAMHDTLANRSLVSYEPLSEQQKYDIQSQIRRYLGDELLELNVVNLRQISGTYEAFKEIYCGMEIEMEAKLREKYFLINKNDPGAIAEAQKMLIELAAEKLEAKQVGSFVAADDSLLVGDLEGGTYGITAPQTISKSDMSAAYAQFKQKEREKDRDKERRKLSQRSVSPQVEKVSASSSNIIKGDKIERSLSIEKGDKPEKENDGLYSPVSSAGNISRIDKSYRQSIGMKEVEEPIQTEAKIEQGRDTPPSRTSAFEDFKAEKGSEINRILIENKEILSSKKKLYSELANEINKLKYSIDQSRERLEQLKVQREADGPLFNEDGDIIISEAEYLEIQKLKDLKAIYRTKYDELHNTKSEIVYCQKLVDQCRLRLIQEFDNWYSESFLTSGEENQTSMSSGQGLKPGILIPLTTISMEDEQEKFERLQMELIMNNPESAAYFNAQMRTARRKIYGSAMNQPQPAFQRQPGTPTMTVRNKPPNMMQVQY